MITGYLTTGTNKSVFSLNMLIFVQMFKKHLFKILTISIAILMIAGCTTTRYPYKKKKKSRKCDCPRWSYLHHENAVTCYVPILSEGAQQVSP